MILTKFTVLIQVEFWPPADGDDDKQLWVLEPAPPGGES